MKIKSILTHFLRFEKQFVYVATEAGFFNSDVLGVDKNDRLIEFEIKVSFRDFMADFKKSKHDLFQGRVPEELLSRWGMVDGSYKLLDNPQIPERLIESVPYRFYFVVTKEIEEKCLAHINSNNLPYGLYSFSEDGVLDLIKRAPILKKHEATDRIKDVLALRMSSEIAGLRVKIEGLKEDLNFHKNKISTYEQRFMEIEKVENEEE